MQGQYGVRGTTLLVVTSMVGSGVFTTTGLLLESLPSAWAVLGVWLLGGVVSLAGAWTYAELATAANESGGEYVLVSRFVHPAAGFVVGVLSFVVGFCAPIAACSFACVRYASAAWFGQVPEEGEPASAVELAVASLLVALWSLVHARSPASRGSRVQDALTLGKLALLLACIVFGVALLGERTGIGAFAPSHEPVHPGAVGLGVVLVSFAYSGWNAAAYFAGDVPNPERVLPKALVGGTAAVTALYVLVNALILASAPREQLAGHIVVGHVAAEALAGPAAARGLSAIIAFGLVSTVGAFVWTGPRILEAVGRRMPHVHSLAEPRVAFSVQATIALALLWTATFDVLLGSIGIALSVASALTVASVFHVRRRGHDGFKAPFHPIPALVYLGLMVATVTAGLVEQPSLGLIGAITVAVGWVGFVVVSRKRQ